MSTTAARGPEAIVFELGRLARFGEPGLCLEEIICVLDEANELGVRHAVLEVTGLLRSEDLVRLASSAAKRVPHVTVVIGREPLLDAGIAAELSDAGVCDVGFPIGICSDLDHGLLAVIETIRDEGLGARAIAPAWPGLSGLTAIACRLAMTGITRLHLDMACMATRCPVTAPMVERLAREIVSVARAGILAMIVTELPLVRRIDFEVSRATGSDVRAIPRAPIDLHDSRTTMRIAACGDVTPSRALPLVAGNVRRQRLDGIWSVPGLYPSLRDRERLAGRCGDCAWRELCGGSRARAWHAEGDYCASDPACALTVMPAATSLHSATA